MMEIEHGGRRYAVSGGELVIGADARCTVVVPGARPRHAIIRSLGERMAMIQPAEAGAQVLVNGVAVGIEPTPLLDGDAIEIGGETLVVQNPTHPAGGPTAPPPGARERLHDTLFGLPRRPPPPPPAPLPSPAPRLRGGPLVIVLVAAVSLGLILFLLFR
jgi:hypothetical protein